MSMRMLLTVHDYLAGGVLKPAFMALHPSRLGTETGWLAAGDRSTAYRDSTVT